MAKYAVGTVHESHNDGDFVITEYVDYFHRGIRFIDTGFATTVNVSSIHSGSIKDPLLPSVCGVGCIGHDPELMDHPLRKVLMRRWNSMIQRVYVHRTGKTIDPSWLNFYTFMRDALNLKGIDLLYTHGKTNRIDLDSDILAKEKGLTPMYSKETCQWVHQAENLRVRERPKQYVKRPLGTVIETRHGPVTIIEKDGPKWLIQFNDGTQKWCWSIAVLRDQISI